MGTPSLTNNDLRRFSIDYNKFLSGVRELTRAIASLFPEQVAANDATTAKASGNVVSVADELKKFMELMYIGAITPAEYEKKKKELLNL